MFKRLDFNYKIYVILALLLMTSVYFLNFNIDIGFALKPYMWMSLIISIVLLLNYKKNIRCLVKDGISGLKDNLLNYEKLFILFFIFATIRGIFSQFYIDSIKMTVALGTVIFLYFVLYQILKRIDIPTIINLIFISGMVFALLSLIFFVIGIESAGFMDRGIYRLTGLVQDPNIFVLFMTPAYSIAIFKIINREYKYIIGLIFMIIPMLLSYSRGGLIGITIVTMLILISNLSKELLKKIVIVFFIIIAVLVTLFMFTDINEWINNIVGIDIIDIIKRRINPGNGSGRIPLWKNSIVFLSMYPIIGIGLYNFRQYNQLYFDNPRYVHNVFLEVTCENGIIGSTIFALFLGLFIKKKSTCKESRIVKFIIISQLIQLFFLSGLSSEVVYMMFAVYKSIEHINSKKLNM